MRFIEIKSGFSVNTDLIEAIELVDEFTSKVHTRFNVYEANFPYMTLLRILAEETGEKPKQEKVMQKLETVLDNAQHFSG